MSSFILNSSETFYESNTFDVLILLPEPWSAWSCTGKIITLMFNRNQTTVALRKKNGLSDLWEQLVYKKWLIGVEEVRLENKDSYNSKKGLLQMETKYLKCSTCYTLLPRATMFTSYFDKEKFFNMMENDYMDCGSTARWTGSMNSEFLIARNEWATTTVINLG